MSRVFIHKRQRSFDKSSNPAESDNQDLVATVEHDDGSVSDESYNLPNSPDTDEATDEDEFRL